MQKKIALGTLLFVYLLSAAAAWHNPLGIMDHQVSISLQAGTLATLAIMIPLLHHKFTSALLTVLAISFVTRVFFTTFIATSPEDQKKSWVVRWDAFAMLGGLLATTGFAAHSIGGTPFMILLLLIGIPLLTAFPRISNATDTHAQLLESSLHIASKAYAAARDEATKDAEFIHDSHTGTLSGVTTFENSGDVYVFFAGSTSWTDWIRVNADVKLDTIPSSWGLSPKAKIHRGFLRGYAAVRTKLWSTLQDMILRTGGSKRIVVCGHSLGGALATVAAVDIANRLDPQDAAKIACVTFGAPQVGDGLFVEAFDDIVPLSLRVAAVYDPVPKVFSTQLPHVRGYVPLASPPILPYTHSIEAYTWGVRQKPMTNALIMAAPMAFVVIFAIIFAYFAPKLR